MLHGRKIMPTGSAQKQAIRRMNAKRISAGKKVAGTKLGAALHGSGGKKMLAGGLAAGVAIGTMKSRTGRGADRGYGRSTGMYGY